ncbi:TetR family transcriptional regulator [Mycolicibacterium aubagnense]|uniref:TetR family transcriptional regulator n=2 Tax=Mycolicibacterium aubagnense TaxID=319707 RepID=A0ABN5YXM5_9MYCO|nr:TetR family transcriptional regulator [Mycolicibacterium aubagnense]
MNGAQRRVLIVDAARTLLAERPYDDVSIADIAAEAGVTRTVVYDHFPSKKDLVLSFLADEVTALVAVLSERISGSTGTPRDRMAAVLDAHFEFLHTRPLAFRILALDSLADPEIAEVGLQLSQTADQALGAALAGDLASAGFTADSPLLEAKLVLLTSAIRGVSTWWLNHPEVSRREIVDTTTEWLWHGISGLACG